MSLVTLVDRRDGLHAGRKGIHGEGRRALGVEKGRTDGLAATHEADAAGGAGGAGIGRLDGGGECGLCPAGALDCRGCKGGASLPEWWRRGLTEGSRGGQKDDNSQQKREKNASDGDRSRE